MDIEKSLDWNLVKVLGRGSFGEVLLLRESHVGDILAVKKFHVPRHFSASVNSISEFQSRCQEEVRMMCSIKHSNIVATVEPPEGLTDKISELMRAFNNQKGNQCILQPSPLPFLFMEYCPGGDVRALLKRPENLNGLQEKQVRTLLFHISDAIAHLHDINIIHRDIKPENIIIQFDPTTKKAIFKLSDLGLAKDVSSKESLCSSFVGTLSYIAPEIFFRRKYDKMVDYWSFGLIAFEAACGVLPFSVEESLGLQFRKHLPLQESSLSFSREIPQRSQLSELFRSSLSTWLATMLQADPLQRGKCSVLPSHPSTDAPSSVCSLRNIRQCLCINRIEIHTPTGRFAYAINSSAKMSEVHTWLTRDTSIDVKSQLLLTKNGTPVKPDELATIYSDNEDCSNLFLINKFQDQLCLKIILPQILSEFLRNSNADNTNQEVSRKLWNSAIYYVQTQLSQTSAAAKAMELLQLQNNTDSGFGKTRQDCKQLQANLKDKFVKLNALIQLDEKLQEVEGRYEKYLRFTEPTSSRQMSSEIISRIEELLTEETIEYLVKPVDLLKLKQLYKQLLEDYGLWRTAELKKMTYSMNNLRTLICLFINSQQSVLTSVNSNVKFFLRNSFEHQEKLLNGLAEVDNAIDQVVRRRLNKQEKILKMACPTLQTYGSVDILNFKLPQFNFRGRNWQHKSLASSKEISRSLNSVENDSNSSSDNTDLQSTASSVYK